MQYADISPCINLVYEGEHLDLSLALGSPLYHHIQPAFTNIQNIQNTYILKNI